MTTYKETNGTNIEILSTDPANPVQGQIWYNTTSSTLKGLGYIATAAWSTGGNMNTARRSVMGAGITNTAALAISGTDDPPVIANVESYNGSSWTEITDVNTASSGGAGTGTNTA